MHNIKNENYQSNNNKKPAFYVWNNFVKKNITLKTNSTTIQKVDLLKF